MSDDYGVQLIQSPNGEKLYFRRDTRGLNYDSLSLSRNSNYCAEPDPNEAVIFNGHGDQPVFYKFEGNTLHIFDGGYIKMPPHFSDKVSVVVHKISNPEYIALEQNYQKKGLERSEVPANLKCSR